MFVVFISFFSCS